MIEEGWCNKPKGTLQILFERGWINPTHNKDYTWHGKINDLGIVNESTSIKALLNKQPDFISEMTLLQFIGDEIDVVVDRSPKCHSELAGEVIEYAWAVVKLFTAAVIYE